MNELASYSGDATIRPEQSNVDESVAYKLVREAQMIGSGVGGAFLDTLKDPLSKAPELATAGGIGVGLNLLARAGARGRVVAGVLGGALALKMAYDEYTGDRWSNFGWALNDTWRTSKNFDINVEATKASVGAFAVDNAVGAVGFMAAGSQFGDRVFDRIPIKMKADPLTGQRKFNTARSHSMGATRSEFQSAPFNGPQGFSTAPDSAFARKPSQINSVSRAAAAHDAVIAMEPWSTPDPAVSRAMAANKTVFESPSWTVRDPGNTSKVQVDTTFLEPRGAQMAPPDGAFIPDAHTYRDVPHLAPQTLDSRAVLHPPAIGPAGELRFPARTLADFVFGKYGSEAPVSEAWVGDSMAVRAARHPVWEEWIGHEGHILRPEVADTLRALEMELGSYSTRDFSRVLSVAEHVGAGRPNREYVRALDFVNDSRALAREQTLMRDQNSISGEQSSSQ